MKTIIKLIMGAILFSGCGGSKIETLLKKGSIAQQSFKTTIPFEYRNGLMILKIELQGKTYDFMLDTGASNVISKEIMETHNLQPMDSELVYDTQNVSQELEYTSIDNIKIGNLNFLNTITAIFDFDQNKELLSDLNIQGIIGANLMRKAIWDIDFKNKQITITNSESSLDIPESYNEMKFYIGYQGTPSIITKVNNMRVLNNRIDTGFTGAINLSKIEFQKLIEKKKINTYINGKGSNAVGIYGLLKPQTYYEGVIDHMRFGDLTLDPSIVSFSGIDNKLIGIEFLKNYRAIFNWDTRRIKLIEETPYKNSILKSYGFAPYRKENKSYVASIISESDAAKKGVLLGDQILKINNIDCSKLTRKEWKNLLQESFSKGSENSMSITIQRADIIKKFTIRKTELLNSKA